MTTKELQKRNGKSENLRVLQTDDGSYFCESSEGKILYGVTINDEGMSCTCGDFARNTKREANFKCKHILSVLNCIPHGEVEGAHFLDRKKPQLDPRFIISIDGHDFVKYQGLLDLGHQKGIAQIEVEVVQLPTAENGNFAVCKANVVSKSGESFTDVGDANPLSCSSKVAKHLLRLASTRAIARALRSYCNVGLTALEEISDISDVTGNESDNRKPKIVRNAGSQLKPVKKTESAPEKITPAQDENPAAQIQTDIAEKPNESTSKGNGSGRPQSSAKAPESKPPKETAPSETKTDSKTPECKVKFGFLTPEGNVVFYRKMLAGSISSPIDNEGLAALKRISNLAPGDFKNVKDRYALHLSESLNHKILVDALAEESRIKDLHAHVKLIGF